MPLGKYFKDPKKPNDSAGQTVAERNAANWRNGGYDKYRQGDAQRAKDLPVGGMAPIREESVPPAPQPMKPRKTFGQKIGSKD